MEKKFPDLKFFSLILAEKPLFFPDFPDWKKSSKISLNSLISLIGGNPVTVKLKQIIRNSETEFLNNSLEKHDFSDFNITNQICFKKTFLEQQV